MTATNIHIRITGPRPEPVRKRVTIPQSDHGTQDWWDAQRDPSTSVRLLILREVSANGFTDTVNKFGTPRATSIAAAPVAAQPVVPVAPAAAPTPPVDPRDVEISRLVGLLGQYREASPFLSYFMPEHKPV